MRWGIQTKIFVTMLAGALLLVIGMSLFIRWSFDRGFLRYINTLEQKQMSTIADQAGHLYQQLGDWQALKNDPRLWRQLLWQVRPGGPPGMDGLEGGGPGHRRGPGMRPGMGRFGGRLQLLDADRRLVVGRPDVNNPTYQPIVIDDRTVGYLALAPRRLLTDRVQLGFAEQQRNALIWIALGMVLLAALLSLPLSRRMVRRVGKLASGTHALAAGQYQTRLAVQGNDELSRLTQDFNTLARTLEQNERGRRAWVADISHELRTPLSVLRGELEAIQDGLRQADPPTVAVLHSEVMQLTRLVEDLYQLSLSDLGALSYRKNSIRPVPLLEEVLDHFRPRLTQKGIKLTLASDASDATVEADAERLQQLFSNLLENSLKYTDADGRIDLRVTTESDQWIVKLCDSAPAVPPQDLPRLFERLFRVDPSRNRASGGGGLGLSICQNIVDAHGGSITAHPSHLGGLCIHLTLPLHPAKGLT